jgi:hypothetical protein
MPRIGRLTPDLLGRQVLHRARDGAGLRHAAVCEGPRQTEVRDLHHAVLCHEQVLGLDVSMHETFVMRMSEGQERLAEDLRRLRRLHPPLLVQEVPDARAAHVLHDHVVHAVHRTPVVDVDDVGVREAGGGPGLAPEAVHEGGIASQGPVQDLDRDLTRQDGVVGSEHLAHPSGGDPFHHVVAAVEGDGCKPSAVRGRRLRDTPCDGALLPREALEGRSERVRRIVPPDLEATVEAGGSPSGGLGAELDRIEAAVQAGDSDLRRLGFWRVVALVKRDDELIERHAEQVGRIDRRAFLARIRFLVPVGLGNAILLVVVAVGGLAVWVAVETSPRTAPDADPTVAGLALLVAAGAWAVGFHSPTHWLVGRLVGIRFTDYFLGGKPIPYPGLKTEYATYLRADPMGRAWMHASGAVATKLAPFLALAFAPAAGAPWWAVAALLALGAFQIATDVVISTKRSDWKKVRRELAVARARGRAA